MAAAAERIVIEHTPFTELTQVFANLLNDYEKGTTKETFERCLKLKGMVATEKGVGCPQCGVFAGKKL